MAEHFVVDKKTLAFIQTLQGPAQTGWIRDELSLKTKPAVYWGESSQIEFPHVSSIYNDETAARFEYGLKRRTTEELADILIKAVEINDVDVLSMRSTIRDVLFKRLDYKDALNKYISKAFPEVSLSVMTALDGYVHFNFNSKLGTLVQSQIIPFLSVLPSNKAKNLVKALSSDQLIDTIPGEQMLPAIYEELSRRGDLFKVADHYSEAKALFMRGAPESDACNALHILLPTLFWQDIKDMKKVLFDTCNPKAILLRETLEYRGLQEPSGHTGLDRIYDTCEPVECDHLPPKVAGIIPPTLDD